MEMGKIKPPINKVYQIMFITCLFIYVNWPVAFITSCLLCELRVQGGPSGGGQAIVDIGMRVAIEYKEFIQAELLIWCQEKVFRDQMDQPVQLSKTAILGPLFPPLVVYTDQLLSLFATTTCLSKPVQSVRSFVPRNQTLTGHARQVNPFTVLVMLF